MTGRLWRDRSAAYKNGIVAGASCLPVVAITGGWRLAAWAAALWLPVALATAALDPWLYPNGGRR